jgi:hypothetical protein
MPEAQMGVGQVVPMGIAAAGVTAELQSALLQQAAHVLPQHKRPFLAHTPALFTHVCLVRSQESCVQSLWSSHWELFVH